MPEIDQKKFKLSLRPQTNSNSKTAYSPESPATDSRLAGLPEWLDRAVDQPWNRTASEHLDFWLWCIEQGLGGMA